LHARQSLLGNCKENGRFECDLRSTIALCVATDSRFDQSPINVFDRFAKFLYLIVLSLNFLSTSKKINNPVNNIWIWHLTSWSSVNWSNLVEIVLRLNFRFSKYRFVYNSTLALRSDAHPTDMCWHNLIQLVNPK